MPKKVSIIMPCYNVVKYIDKSMNSLLNQTIGIDNIEIICVNDASTDDTLQILKDYEMKYPETILLIDLPENQKQGGARNIGLQYASGEYVCFCDADDWASTMLCERAYEKAIENDAEVVCYDRFDFVEDDNFVPETIYTGRVSRLLLIDSDEKRKYLLENVISERFFNCTCNNKLYKKSFLEESKVYFPSHCVLEEALFVYPIYFYMKRFYVLEEKLYYYRYNPAGTMVNTLKSINKWLDHVKVHIMLFDEMQKRGLLAKYHDEIELYFLWNLYIETIGFIFRYTDHFPMDIYESLRDTVKTCFPNYHMNSYINKPEYEEFSKALHSITVKHSQEELDKLKDSWITLEDYRRINNRTGK
jgi:glycosyltransferase involved in cell wall biosynthesis